MPMRLWSSCPSVYIAPYFTCVLADCQYIQLNFSFNTPLSLSQASLKRTKRCSISLPSTTVPAVTGLDNGLDNSIDRQSIVYY